MTAKLYYLSKDILRIIDGYTHGEINYHDLLEWVKKHPCLTKNYCTSMETEMINSFYQVIKQNNSNKRGLLRYRDKIILKYLQEKYTEST